MFEDFAIGGVSLNALSQCTFESWQPQIGDPNLMGWLTVAFYLITFGLCLVVSRNPRRASSASRSFWFALGILMLFLAINKQLDLQSLATAGARCIAVIQGWYRDRAAFQFGAILSLAIFALLAGVYFLWLLRRDLKRNFLALLGLTVVLAFVMVRAVGFHYVDVFIKIEIGPVKINHILEMFGLFLISLNALILLNRGKRPPTGRRRRSKQSKVYRRET